MYLCLCWSSGNINTAPKENDGIVTKSNAI